MINIKDLEQLERQVRAALAGRDPRSLRALLAAQHPADVADVLDRLNPAAEIAVFRQLTPGQAAAVLDETGVTATRELLARLSLQEAGAILDLLPADDAAELLSEDVPDLQQVLLAAMEQRDADEVRNLLQFPPRSAGRLMIDRFARARPQMTSAEAVEYLRAIDPAAQSVDNLYVLDEHGRLAGMVSLHELIVASPEQRLAAFMRTNIVCVTPQAEQEEVARLVARYDFTVMPVVGADGRMLGIITVDDVIDVLVEESSEDALRFAGVEGGASDQPYFSVSISTAVRKRILWLLLLFLAETLTGSVLRFFEAELAQVVALSFFIPLLIGTGGNTGAQTVSTLIRGLALGEIRLSDTWRVLWREFGSGLLLGVLLAAVGFGRALLWDSGFELSLVVALSLICICTWSNTVGALIPLAARRFGIDPAIVSAPLITTLVDATGLAIYLIIAKAILGI